MSAARTPTIPVKRAAHIAFRDAREEGDRAALLKLAEDPTLSAEMRKAARCVANSFPVSPSKEGGKNAETAENQR